MISQSVGSSPESGSVLPVQRLLEILSLPLSLPIPQLLLLFISLSLKKTKMEPSKGEAHFVTKGLNSVWASLR